MITLELIDNLIVVKKDKEIIEDIFESFHGLNYAQVIFYLRRMKKFKLSKIIFNEYQ